MFSFISDIFTTQGVIQTVLFLTLISIVGLALGRIKIGSFSFGGAFVFFVAILAGHLAARAGITVNKSMMELAKSFGIMIFVFTLGLQAGPGFVASLRKGGTILTLSAVIGIVLETALAIGVMYMFGLSAAETVGIYSGSVTNTPMLIAAQEAANDPVAGNMIGSAYAATYPVSVMLVMLCVALMCKFYPSSFSKAKGDSGKTVNVVLEYRVSDPKLFGKTVKAIVKESGLHFVISRIWKNGVVTIPLSDTVVAEGDHMMVICSTDNRKALDKYLGKEEDKDWNKADIDWNIIDKNMISQHISVTKTDVIGYTFGELKLRNKYGVNITRLERCGVSLVPSASTVIQFGDKLTVVGDEAKVAMLAAALGNEVKRLEEPRLIPLLAGIFLGVLLGSIPFMIPGLDAPVKLGIAGGSIIVGLIVGAGSSILRLHVYTTRSANLMLRQLGITFFFAAVGYSVGGTFVENVFCIRGLSWIGISTIIILVPILIMGFVNEKFFKFDFGKNLGVLCGMCTNPNALSFGGTLMGNEKPSEAYATVYPVVTFLRIFLGQVLMMALAA